jgi:predicted ATPase/DNA-binding SARP family transcriptional activator
MDRELPADRSPSLRVGVLGPLAVQIDGEAIEVPGHRQRALIALLALAEGRTVTTDHLLEALWPGVELEAARRSLHSCVSRSRGALGPAATRLTTRPDGYRLTLAPEELDLALVRGLLARARTIQADEPSAAYDLLREAHGSWRGPILADLDDVLPVAAAVQEAAELYRTVTDALIACGIRAGAAEEVVGVAAAAALDDPLREPVVLLLMRALAAAGRPAEALDAARELRRRLADEAGLDASPALDALQRTIAAGTVARAPRATAGPALAATPLLGREAEIAGLRHRLAEARLVTIVGPGGVGKTSVALAIARARDDAVELPLAAVRDPAAVPHALASALELEGPRGDALASCVMILADRPTLLVVDNCEHLLDAVRDAVDVVLACCPEVHVLATSREPLGLPAEHVVRLPSLPLPAPGDDPHANPAVALFLDRAAKVRSGFDPSPDELDDVVAIVRRLDGLPLAIELAAGRLSTFSAGDLLRRLDRSLDLLGDGRPGSDARHRTLRATLMWSYDLLAADERLLFRHLSAFVDGVPLDTAESIARELGMAREPGQVLARLVDASLLEPEFDDGTRYRMLDVVRTFGQDRLDAAREVERAELALVRWAVELTAWFATTVATEREPTADAVLRRELPNLRAAWGVARRRGDLDAAVAMVGASFDAIGYRDLVEFRAWATELAADPALVRHPRAATVLGTAAEAAYHGGDLGSAERLACLGLELAVDAEDTWPCHVARSVVALARGAVTEAVTHALEAAAVGLHRGDPYGLAALATAYAGGLEEARRLNALGLDGASSPCMRAWGAYVGAEIDALDGRHELAEARYREAVDLAATAGATFLVGIATVGLLAARSRGADARDVLAGYLETIDYFARTGNWTHLWATLRNLAELLRRLGDDEVAGALEIAADQAADAPAVIRPTPDPHPAGPITSALPKVEVLAIARRAIDRHLAPTHGGSWRRAP